MKKNIIKNYIYNISYQVIALLIPLVTTPYLSRVLGPDGIGISAFTISVVSYFVLFGSLGISIYGQREIAYVQDDKIKRTEKFIELLSLKAISLLLTILIYVFFCKGSAYFIYYRVLIFEIIASFFDISWFFQGIENFKVTVIKNLIIKILSLVCIFCVVKDIEDVNKYLLIYGSSTLIGNLSLWLHLKREICKVSLKNIKIFKNLKYILIFFIPQIANRLYSILDKTMLGIIIPDIAETGFYEQADKIVKIWITVITALGTVIMPRMANYYAKKENKKINSLMIKTIRYVYFCSFPLIFGLIAVSPNIIPVYLGNGYNKSIELIKILSPAILIIGLNNIIGNQYLISTGQQKKYTIAVIIGTIVNFILNLIFIRIFNSYGASLATIISEIIVLSVEVYFIRNQFKLKEIIRNGNNYFIASFIMFIFIMIISNITNNLIINSVIQFCIGIIVYITILIMLKDDFLLYIIHKTKNYIIKK